MWHCAELFQLLKSFIAKRKKKKHTTLSFCVFWNLNAWSRPYRASDNDKALGVRLPFNFTQFDSVFKQPVFQVYFNQNLKLGVFYETTAAK